MAAQPLNPDSVSRLVMLTYGKMQDGKGTYWCYVAVKPSEMDRFNATLKAGKLNLHKFKDEGYGEVLVSGPGLYPPKEVTKEIAKAFNTAVTELFTNAEPKSLIARKIEELKKKAESQT
jgi:tripartite-type tricarboxylate transporter receptor subunit TctC